MSDQGRDNHPGAYLSWAWWIGLIGLIITIICVGMLIGFIVDVARQAAHSNNFDRLFVSFPLLSACISSVFCFILVIKTGNKRFGTFLRSQHFLQTHQCHFFRTRPTNDGLHKTRLHSGLILRLMSRISHRSLQ